MDETGKIIGGAWIAYVVSIAILIAVTGTVDYKPAQIENSYVVSTSDDTIQYGLPSATGYPESEVGFSDCAIALSVNGTACQPMDLRLQNVAGFSSQEVEARGIEGVGTLNATVFAEGEVNYIVTVYDPDKNGIVSPGDYVTVQCTEPLSSGSSYSLYFFTDIDGTRGIGVICGTYTA